MGGLFAKNREVSNVYLFVIMMLLLLIIGLRDVTVGVDTASYINDYENISRMSFSEMWKYAIATEEPLYVIISWFPSMFSLNFTSYLMLWALFPVISLYKIFKSELVDGYDYIVSIIVFFLLGLFAFYVAGIRQTAALSVIFLGYRYLNKLSLKGLRAFLMDKNVYLFLLTIAVAYMIHNSSIIFLLALPCLFFRVRWWYLVLVIGLFFLGRVVKIDQIVILSKLLFEDRFENYGTTYESSISVSALIMQVILFLMCFIVKGKLIHENKQNNMLFNLMFLGLLFQALSGTIAEMSRVSFYFSMFAMILVPRALKEYSINYRLFAYIGFVIFSFFYLFFLTDSNLPTYYSIL